VPRPGDSSSLRPPDPARLPQQLADLLHEKAYDQVLDRIDPRPRHSILLASGFQKSHARRTDR